MWPAANQMFNTFDGTVNCSTSECPANIATYCKDELDQLWTMVARYFGRSAKTDDSAASNGSAVAMASLVVPNSSSNAAMFSFELGNMSSRTILASWPTSVSTFPLRGPGNRTRTRTVYYEPTSIDGSGPGCSGQGGVGCAAFGLQLIVERTTYHQQLLGDSVDAGLYSVNEWKLLFRQATDKSPAPNAQPLCDVRSLDMAMPLPPTANLTLEMR
eukprot:COSAG05_NODE_346_length_10975_cov_5.664675_6_plen_215_part_00